MLYLVEFLLFIVYFDLFETPAFLGCDYQLFTSPVGSYFLLWKFQIDRFCVSYELFEVIELQSL